MNKAGIDSVSPEGEPTISVIMSVYKEPIEWLRLSIKSILKQTFTDFEFIIICDNPLYTEGISILKEYAMSDRRIILIFNETNIGLTKSLNKGLVISKGKYIARMDADDISLPVRFERQYDYMESHPNVIVLGTNIKYIGKGAWKKAGDGIRFNDEEIRSQMLIGNCIAHPTVFIRKYVLDENGLSYDESYKHSQDMRLWEQMWEYGEFANLREKLLMYRLSDQQITKSSTLSQFNLSDSVKHRLQKRWLEGLGYNYSIDTIKRAPFEIIEELRKDDQVNGSAQFASFVQNAYLNNPCDNKKRTLFKNKDYRYIPLMNLVRILIK